MKNFFTIFVLLILFATSTLIAQINWTKHNGNPVLTPGPTGAWDEEFVGTPSVLFDGSTYHLWYSGYNYIAGRSVGIGYATSNDGISWTKYDDPSTTNPPYSQSDPVLTPGPGSYDNIGAGFQCVLKIDSIYHMWYTGDNHVANNQGLTICHAISLNGISWIKDTLNPVLNVGQNGSWDDVWVNAPSVVFDGSMYHMWYAAWNGDYPPSHVLIGHATSPHPDSSWTKDPNNPVLDKGTPTCWDYDRVDAPNVIYDGSLFHMFYSGGFTLKWRIGYAWSTDGSNWFKYNDPNTTIPLFRVSDLVLDWGPQGTFDDSNVSHCSVLLDTLNDFLKMWYTGADANPYTQVQVGYATAPLSTIHVPGNYLTIQAAINSASDGDVVLVADGTYQENINFKGKAITVASHFYVNGDTSHISNTIIDGSNPSHPDSGSVVTFNSGEDTTSILMGFTVTGGSGTSDFYFGSTSRQGGGINIFYSGAKIINNKIINNALITAGLFKWGAGISGIGGPQSYIIIHENEISNNTSTGHHVWGGGVGMFTQGTISLDGNIIQNNIITTSGSFNCRGAGITVDGSSGYTGINTICNNLIRNNEAINSSNDAYGGGAYIRSVSPLLYNNIITGNISSGGAGINIKYSTVAPGPTHAILINNTITQNESGSGAGIVVSGTLAKATVINTIVWDNIGPEITIFDGTITVAYSDVQGGYTGTGNIDTDPLFADTVLFNLTQNSLCIGAGIDSIQIAGNWYFAPPFDYDGDPRPNPTDEFVDIGAQESYFLTGIEKENSHILPKTFALKQNYPNPFNPKTTIEFSIPKAEYVTLKIFNLLGQEVTTLVSDKLTPGEYKYTWDASHLASGVYIYKMQTDNGFTKTKKLLLIK